MTRKDYILIARALQDAYTADGDAFKRRGGGNHFHDGVTASADYLASVLEQDNPRFDRDHFLAVVRGEKALTSRPPR